MTQGKIRPLEIQIALISSGSNEMFVGVVNFKALDKCSLTIPRTSQTLHQPLGDNSSQVHSDKETSICS